MAHYAQDLPAKQKFNMLPTLVASAAFFLSCMDVLITNMALPTIEAQMGGGMAAQQWIVDGYTLPFATLLLLAGNFSDRFGAKRIFLVGIAGFALASGICGMAPNVGILIFGRVLLGVSAALISPSSMAVINEGYASGADRTRALAIWGMGGSVATACGPLLGGLLVPIHWSLVFFINIPVCVAILVAARHLAPSLQVKAPVDVVGQLLAMVGVGALVGGIIEGGSLGFDSLVARLLVIVGMGGLALFLVNEKRCDHPMMPFGLFESAGMRVALLGGFIHVFNWNGVVFLCTLFLQQEQGLSPLESGLAFIPCALISAFGSYVGARISGARGIKAALLLGVAGMMASFGWLVLSSPGYDLLRVAVGVSFIGLGGGIATPAFANLVLRSAPAAQAGIASAVFNALRQVGGAMGIALLGVVAMAAPGFSVGMATAFSVSFVLIIALTALIARARL